MMSHHNQDKLLIEQVAQFCSEDSKGFIKMGFDSSDRNAQTLRNLHIGKILHTAEQKYFTAPIR